MPLTVLEKKMLSKAYTKAKQLLRDFQPDLLDIKVLWAHGEEENTLKSTIRQGDLDSEASNSDITESELLQGIEALLAISEMIEERRDELTQLSVRVGE